MDIPAIGTNQLSTLKSNICDDCLGDFSIILIHHNPLPTNNQDLKPYASIIDAGPFLSYCMESLKHIIILHGHAHCESEMTVTKYDYKGNQKAWITALGNKKFYHAASIIDIWLTSNNEFITANITDIEYVASKYNSKHKSVLRSTERPKSLEWIQKSPFNGRKLKFGELAKAIGIDANEVLATVLLQNENILFDINKHNSIDFNDWSIGSLI